MDTILLAHFAAPKENEVCADFGTGCGTIPLIWSVRWQPERIVGVELQKKAFLQAEASVKENGLARQIALINGDVRESRTFLPHQAFGLVACNPPYKAVGAGLQNAENSRKFARHEETLTLKDVAENAAFVLKHGGRLCICQRPERLTDALTVFRAHRLEPKRLRLVQQRAGSKPSLFLLEARRGGKSGMHIEPVLLVEGKGGYSEEMKEVYGEYRLTF